MPPSGVSIQIKAAMSVYPSIVVLGPNSGAERLAVDYPLHVRTRKVLLFTVTVHRNSMRSLPPKQDESELDFSSEAVALCDERVLEGVRTVSAALGSLQAAINSVILPYALI
jgi:hypothetical protein